MTEFIAAQMGATAINQIFNGLVLGMIFILISIGLSIIFGMMGIINFAHGEFLLIGAYVTWATMAIVDSLAIGALMAIVAVAGLSVIVERGLLAPIYDRNPIWQLLLTFGLAEVLREGVQIIWGRRGKAVSIPEWGQGTISIGVVNYPIYRMSVIVLGTVLVLLVYAFLTRSDYGMIISAGTQDREMTRMVGVEISKVFLLVFVLGGVLVAIAGAFLAPLRGVYPTLGVEFLIPAFVVVVIGGLGSFKGSVIAGLIVGQVMSWASLIAPATSNVVIYILMAVILVLRPRGLFGKEGVIEH